MFRGSLPAPPTPLQIQESPTAWTCDWVRLLLSKSLLESQPVKPVQLYVKELFLARPFMLTSLLSSHPHSCLSYPPVLPCLAEERALQCEGPQRRSELRAESFISVVEKVGGGAGWLMA